jgi:superfamily I DNA/RNA helicase
MGAVSMLEDAVERRDENDIPLQQPTSATEKISQKTCSIDSLSEKYLPELKSGFRTLLRTGERLRPELLTHADSLETLREILLPVKDLDETSSEFWHHLLPVQRRLSEFFADDTAADIVSRSDLSRSLQVARSRLMVWDKYLVELSSSSAENAGHGPLDAVIRFRSNLKDDVDALSQLQSRKCETQHLAARFQQLYPLASAAARYRPALHQVSLYDLNEQQRQFVDLDHEGHYRIQGVSGSGKTLILLYRALRLARENPSQVVRVWTINRALADHLWNSTRRLTKSLPKNLHFDAFYDYCRESISLFETLDRYRLVDVQSRETTQRAWQEFYQHHSHSSDQNVFATPLVKQLKDYVECYGGSLQDVSRYLREEVIYIQSAFPRQTRRDYLQMERKSRSIPFHSSYREACLHIVEAWEEWLAVGHLCDLESMTLEAARYIFDDTSLVAIKSQFPADYVLVDEVQDFSTLELSCIRALSSNKEAKNAICFFGDLNQKVYVKNHEFGRAGFRFKNRSSKLSRNYRNSKEILQAAMRLHQAFPPKQDEAEGYELFNPELSPFNGGRPCVMSCTLENHAERIVSLIAARPGKRIAVVSDTEGILEHAQRYAREKGISHIRLRKNDDATRSGSGETIDGQLVFSQLETIKGFEYDTVIVADISHGSYPRKNTPKHEMWRQAATLYAAITRARDELIMTFVCRRSAFLEVMLPEIDLIDVAAYDFYEFLS